MKKLLKNKTFWTVLIALTLVVGVSVKGAMAYFTTYVTAKGGYALELGDEGQIEEEVKDMTKIVSVKNTGTQPEYVRVKVFFGSATGVTVTYEPTTGWSQHDDGYWYYSEVVQPGESTSVLNIKITADETVTPEFNVVVVQECSSSSDFAVIEDKKVDSQDVGGGE